LDDQSPHAIERRANRDRRHQSLRALVVGGFRPRRRRVRRNELPHIAAVDWHSAQWFATAFGILLLCFADSLFTLVLVDRGAIEVNPLMRLLIQGDGRSFALVKLALTASSLVTLILISGRRAFGCLTPGAVLYATLAIYICLIGYELSLLDVWASVY
jgi:hypothetical protein